MHSQLGQDAWILNKFSTPGYFLEIGAFHPTDLSNTYDLELAGWRGVSVDPVPAGDWAGLRPHTVLVDRVITCDGRDVEFVKGDELGGIREHLDHHRHLVEDKPIVTLPSMSVRDLLTEYDVPRHIQYLSLDTEGSELEILQAFPFDEVAVDAITVEHNFEEPKRTQIRDLLASHGFVLETPMKWDDWYVRPTK
jgi:hypothetical protein